MSDVIHVAFELPVELVAFLVRESGTSPVSATLAEILADARERALLDNGDATPGVAH